MWTSERFKYQNLRQPDPRAAWLKELHTKLEANDTETCDSMRTLKDFGEFALCNRIATAFRLSVLNGPRSCYTVACGIKVCRLRLSGFCGLGKATQLPQLTSRLTWTQSDGH